jgi:signal transduction histidine kinase
MAPEPLGRLKLRLTTWYVATFGVILTLLGGGLLLEMRRQYARELDESLRDATTELIRAAHIREMEAPAASKGPVVDAVDELHIPERALYLLTPDGRPIKPDRGEPWITRAAQRASQVGRVDEERKLPDDKTLRLHAERFNLVDGTPLVAVAVANKVEMEDRYASLIAAFGGAAFAALVLVAAGGWLLARQSAAPVERTFEHMRRFMADAAHELRTPLTVLRSRAEIALQRPREPAAYASTLRAIEGETHRLGRIVEDLLTLARADAGERPIARARVYLDDVALDAAGAARAVAEARGVTLSMSEFEEAIVDGDAELLRQLMMILLDNAVKFTPRGGEVLVRVSARAGRPTLVVEDTGVGIPANQLPHVFERFYRGDPARTRGDAATVTADGAGLGLSIARWVVDAHAGEITITSEPGRGTRVSVQFPPATEPAPDRL